MLSADALLDPLAARGFDVFVTVPCSILTPLIDRVLQSRAFDHVGAANEGDAVAIAAGAWLAGRRAVVAFQNSGLGNAVNPLTSLCQPFSIPVLLLVSWRGQPGLTDAPQHRLMGTITPALLEQMCVDCEVLPEEAADLSSRLEPLIATLDERNRSAALLLPRGALGSDGGSRVALPLRRSPAARMAPMPPRPSSPPSRRAVLERMLAVIDDRVAVITSTGKCSRELFTLGDRPSHFYQVGSMGCAGALGLGVARWGRRPVVVVDGDGAVLMRMGVLATAGAYQPRRLVHVLLDNGVHDSTGGQPTVSSVVDLAAVAIACGYRVTRCPEVDAFESALRKALAEPGPHFLHVTTAPGSPAELARPSLPLPELARRFRTFVTGGSQETSTAEEELA